MFSIFTFQTFQSFHETPRFTNSVEIESLSWVILFAIQYNEDLLCLNLLNKPYELSFLITSSSFFKVFYQPKIPIKFCKKTNNNFETAKSKKLHHFFFHALFPTFSLHQISTHNLQVLHILDLWWQILKVIVSQV